MKGLRYNEGKTRYDLVPAFAQEEYAKVLTVGATKYKPRNWEDGMAWSKVLASMERHLAAIKSGEDFDQETGILHSAHIMCNAAFLTEYYKICPEGDDRSHRYFDKLVALDIDEVIADFCGAMMERFTALKERPVYWNDFVLMEKYKEVREDRDFWINIKPKVTSLPFEPHCYITARPVNSGLTEEWLKKHGFPSAPVYTVGHGGSKLQAFKDSGADFLVDDSYKTFVEINNAGYLCYLFDAPHNQRYDVGFKRIKDLNELI